MAYSFRLTEEIARWTFEVACRQRPEWYIAFTNPTAGPWKTIKGTDVNGDEGEVYRFALEETRPDIILVNERLRTILIVEAKDSLGKLGDALQVRKSVEVVAHLSALLRRWGGNPYWRQRATYRVITALNWGAEKKTSSDRRADVFDAYHAELCRYPELDASIVLGVETRRYGPALTCFLCGKAYVPDGMADFDDLSVPAAIADSFGLPLLRS